MRATEGEGTAERGRCRHCGESVILVTFMNYPDTWFHKTPGFWRAGEARPRPRWPRVDAHR